MQILFEGRWERSTEVEEPGCQKEKKKKGQDNSVYMQLLGPVFFYYFFYESNLPFLAVVSVLFLDAL